MLFDVRGKRKRFIQATYLALAILFGVGLIGFGVGGGTGGGGIFDAIGGGGGGGNGAAGTYKKEVTRLERSVRLAPKDEAAWGKLAQARYNLARSSGDYDPNTGQFSGGAAASLASATEAWERYLSLKPRKADVATAGLMLQSYATLIRLANGDPLNRFRRAGAAAAIVAKQRPSPTAYYNVAVIAYQIGQTRQGDRASAETVRLTPKDSRNTVRAQLKDARKQGLKAKRQIAQTKEQARRAAEKAAKSGKDPFGAQPGQTPAAP